MAKRFPLTSADKYVNDMLKRFPELNEIEGRCDSMTTENFEFVAQVCHRIDPLLMFKSTSDLIFDTVADEDLITVSSAPIWSRWRECRHVYRFDKTMADELYETTPCDSMPTDALEMLPYPIIYIDVDYSLPLWSGSSIDGRGFFVWKEAEDIFVFMSEARSPMTIPIGKTFGEVINGSYSNDVKLNDILQERGYETTDVDVSTKDRLKKHIGWVLNLILYIIADNSDQEVIYRPSGSRKRKNKASESTVHEVGAVMGRKLGAARVRYEHGKASGTGTKLRPHVRAGHWHRHWVGSGDKRKLKVMWHEPTFVNAGETVTTIHTD
jgi:hypothetical protein